MGHATIWTLAAGSRAVAVGYSLFVVHSLHATIAGCPPTSVFALESACANSAKRKAGHRSSCPSGWGVDRSYLAEVETGKIEICLRNLELVAQTFGIELHQLVSFSAKG